MRRNQQGVTLIELILVIGLLAMMSILAFYEKQSDLEQAKARIVGGLIFQYNNAVRESLANNIPTASVSYTGSAWLKSSACGGMLTPGQEYLPCDFPLATVANPVPFGHFTLNTVVGVSGTPPNRKFTATTSTSAFSVGEAGGTVKVRADLSGLAVIAAASAVGTGVQSVSGGASPIAATTDSHYKSDPLTGVMTFTSSNTASSDVWLRTDGSNSMHKTLNFDGALPADRQITGASRIQNIAGQALMLGSGSGLTAVTGSGLVVDTSAEILGAFRVRGSEQIDGNSNVSGSISAGGNVSAGGALYGQVFYDSNNSGYYVDPNNTSRLNAVQSNVEYSGIFYDINNAGYYVQPSQTSRLNAVQSNVEYSGIFYDINNTNYYVQPSQTSRFNAVLSNNLANYGYMVNSGRLELGEYIQLDAVSTDGAGCGPNGLISRDASGASLSCVNGVWKAASGVSVGAPVTIFSAGPTRGTWNNCWVSAKNAMITATGPGTTVLTVNGVSVGTVMGWGGEFSDIGMDFAISALVPAGGTYCYYVTNNRAYSTSSGIRVLSFSL